MKASFIRRDHYTIWLANVVMVKKLNGKWQMCVDYTDLNKTWQRREEEGTNEGGVSEQGRRT